MKTQSRSMIPKQCSQSGAYGSRPEVRRARRLLDNGCHVSVVAPRGCGKTRLLQELARASAGPARTNHVAIYLDTSSLEGRSPEQCFQAMHDALLAELASLRPPVRTTCPKPLLGECGFVGLRSALAWCEEAGVRVEYLLDHFDRLARDLEVDSPLLGALRHLGSSPAVTFVCASRASLYDLTGGCSSWSSPFWNLFVVEDLTERQDKADLARLRRRMEESAGPQGSLTVSPDGRAGSV